MNRRFQ